jgi:long-chain acyl-CoA synthetase
VTYSRGLDALAEDFRDVRPHFAVAVPRVFEKIHARVLAQAAGKPRHERALFEWALGVGRRRSLAEERGLPLGPVLAAEVRLADALVFRKLRDAVGGRIALLVSGGAPLSAEVARFFHGAGILICEGWGATETTAPATLNVPSAYRFGSVGRPLPGVEVVVADDGELLIRGENVCAGYLDAPEANAETFDADGFYHTGDIGRRDEDGFFYITDRKKELIITAYGKNVAPQKIENLLRERRFVSNCLVHGDRRSHLVALVTIDRDDVRARRPELADCDAADPRLASLVGAEVDAINAGLPGFEHVRGFRILDHDFSPETGELTPTLKLKRRVIEAKYRALLDELYEPA